MVTIDRLDSNTNYLAGTTTGVASKGGLPRGGAAESEASMGDASTGGGDITAVDAGHSMVVGVINWDV